jgi:hypothetical protein
MEMNSIEEIRQIKTKEDLKAWAQKRFQKAKERGEIRSCYGPWCPGGPLFFLTGEEKKALLEKAKELNKTEFLKLRRKEGEYLLTIDYSQRKFVLNRTKDFTGYCRDPREIVEVCRGDRISFELGQWCDVHLKVWDGKEYHRITFVEIIK